MYNTGSERTICRFWNLLFLFPNFSFAASAAVHRIWQNGAETNWHKTLPKASVSGIFITSDRNSPHINKFNVNLFPLISMFIIKIFKAFMLRCATGTTPMMQLLVEKEASWSFNGFWLLTRTNP